jgi:nitronate monooxygenase
MAQAASGSTSLVRLLGTAPLIQAPMAGVQGSCLAAAVCNAGAMGSLPAAMLGADALCAELGALEAATDRPYNVNFFCHVPPAADTAGEAAWRALLAPFYAQFGLSPDAIAAGPGREPFDATSLAVIEAFRPKVVSFHFGLPDAALLARVKAWGAVVLGSATTVEEARWLEARGADAVIAQGVEAGGHRGMFLTGDLATQLGMHELLRRVVGAVRVPVIAAGGIADAAGVAAAIGLGAAGVQVGSAYLSCPEATTSEVHRAALATGTTLETVVTNLFSGRPARGIVNRLIRELGAIRGDVPAFPLASAALAPLRREAERRGSGDFSPLWCGQGAVGGRQAPAAQLTRALAEGLPAAIR